MVRTDGTIDEWSMELSTLPGQRYRLVLHSATSEAWTGEATDVFECLMQLRDQLEPLGFRLCCNGSRRDAWSSGMQRDMGSGLSTYLLGETPRGQRPPSVPTLGSAPLETVVTAIEQRNWHDAWVAGL